jgi:hypothetical protein
MFVDGMEPPSWNLGDAILDAGEVGLISPSVAQPDGFNVVLFTDRLQSDWLQPHDPNGLLPRDPSSWTR